MTRIQATHRFQKLAILLACISFACCSKAQTKSPEAPPLPSGNVKSTINSLIAAAQKYTGDVDAPLKYTTLLTQIADENDRGCRSAMAALFIRTEQTTSNVLIIIATDSTYLSIKDPEARLTLITALKTIYGRFSDNKSSWDAFRPKLAAWENIPSVKKLIESYEAYAVEVDRLVSARLAEPDLSFQPTK